MINNTIFTSQTYYNKLFILNFFSCFYYYYYFDINLIKIQIEQNINMTNLKNTNIIKYTLLTKNLFAQNI